MLAFKFFQCLRHRFRGRRGGVYRTARLSLLFCAQEGNLRDLYDVAHRNSGGALQAVTQLAHVAGPLILQQSLPHVIRDVKLWTIKTLAVYLKKVINKTWNIFGAFTQ